MPYGSNDLFLGFGIGIGLEVAVAEITGFETSTDSGIFFSIGFSKSFSVFSATATFSATFFGLFTFFQLSF